MDVSPGVAREPLELIAYVVMNDRPYTEVLTADYTMVNAFSDLAYRSRSGFEHEFAAEDGFTTVGRLVFSGPVITMVISRTTRNSK